MVSIMLQVRQGDIFQIEFLGKIRDITRDLKRVTGVNEFQIVSLSSRKLKRIQAGAYSIESHCLMCPDLPESPDGIEKLREAVLSNPLVYGTYVSRDLKATLITIDFIDRLVDYKIISNEVSDIVERHREEGFEISVIGEPILQGWVDRYLPETSLLFVASATTVFLLLFLVFTRSWYGVLIPAVSVTLSLTWALGMASLLRISLDPLGVVIAYIIIAQVVSYSIQSVNRFDIVTGNTSSSQAAAQKSLSCLLRPGLLSVITDGGCKLTMALIPIMFIRKSAIIGSLWLFSIIITGVVLTPILLSWIRHPGKSTHPLTINLLVNRFLKLSAVAAISKARYFILCGAILLIAICGFFGSRITVGNANPGTPLLWPQSDYNKAVAEINRSFVGTDRMFVVLEGNGKNILKEPALLRNMHEFQRYAERQPEISGSRSLTDLIHFMKRTVYEGNPRYQECGRDPLINGELLYFSLQGSDPGDLNYFCDGDFRNAGITLFFSDHRGRTIRTAIARMKEFFKQNRIKEARYSLAGGYIGVIAATNEVIFKGQIKITAFSLLIVLITASIAYRSTIAAIYLMLPIILSNTVTFTYMAVRDIGLNINTLPVVALGIGLGVNYSIYIFDAIKEELAGQRDLGEAIRTALEKAGRGVILATAPLIVCAIPWYFLSSLRFLAEMTLLIALWIGTSALSALFIMPSLVYTLRPGFIVNNR